MSKNGWFSTSQAPNPRPVSDVSNALQAINNKLDMILDALTKPAEKADSEDVSTIELFRVYPEEPARPVAYDVTCNVVQQESKRTKGKPAIQQIETRIEKYWGGMKSVRVKASHGLITAVLHANNPRAGNYYTHTVSITDTVAENKKKRKFQPTLFGITEAREVVAYLESLGVKVNTNTLNRV